MACGLILQFELYHSLKFQHYNFDGVGSLSSTKTRTNSNETFGSIKSRSVRIGKLVFTNQRYITFPPDSIITHQLHAFDTSVHQYINTSVHHLNLIRHDESKCLT